MPRKPDPSDPSDPKKPKSGSASRLEANVSGEQVRMALMEARPAGLTFKQLVLATDLSAYHVRKGINYIKDTAALEHLTPLTWNQRDGYRFPLNIEDWVGYELRQLDTLFLRVGRLINSTLAPHAAAHPEDDFARLALDQLNGLKSGVAMVVLAGTHRRRS
jgi:hypothetical protein